MTVTQCRGCGGVVDIARAAAARFQQSESDTTSMYFHMLERLVEKAQQPDEVMRKIQGLVEKEPLGLQTTTVYFCPPCAEAMEKYGHISQMLAYPPIEGEPTKERTE